jgi:hypothetical protein
MRFKIVSTITLCLLLCLINSICVLACSCRPNGPPREELETAVAVFSGKVTKIENPNKGPVRSSADPVYVSLQVSRVWKGSIATTVMVQTAASGASCGYDSFSVGNEFLVYAHGSDTKLAVSLCSRTRFLSQAAEDLQALGAGAVPVARLAQ